MAIKESALSLITSIAQGDWIRAVTSAGASRRVTVANLAKAIVESYTGSSLVGSNQSVKNAIDSLIPETYTLTKTSKIGTFEFLCKRTGKSVSGSIVFSPTETLGNDFIANGLPVASGGQQLPLICVAGSSDQNGRVGRVRIAGDRVQIWYSNLTPIVGNTYFIPLNYICN